nr:hypothetical protein [Rhizobiaceae bacterium]
MTAVTRRVLIARLQGAGRLLRSSAVIIGIVIVTGLSLSIWARARIDALLRVDPGAAIGLEVLTAKGDCGTSALYVYPSPVGEGSRYLVLVDMLGGGYRAQTTDAEATEAVLSLPFSRRPGVGLGRGLPSSCESLSLAISGEGLRIGLPRRANDTGSAVAMSGASDAASRMVLSYNRPQTPDETHAVATIEVSNVADRWQHGSKRVAFVNSGERDLNVFMHEEPGYQFVNEQDSLVRPIGVRQAYVDVNLAPKGGETDNTVVVYRRRPTSDIELQHDLIGISTIFGIGISLLIEGA